jgi:hypothetical protein
MSKTVFDVQLTHDSRQAKVICNGEDITSQIHSIEISQKPGEIGKIKLGFLFSEGSTRYQGEGDLIIKPETSQELTENSPKDPS